MTIEYLNATTPADLLPYLNRITMGWFAPMILLVIWLVGYLALMNLNPKNSFVGSTFLTLIIGIIMFFMGAVSMGILVILVVALFIGVIALREN